MSEAVLPYSQSGMPGFPDRSSPGQMGKMNFSSEEIQFNTSQLRPVKRAPKLGLIGRSKRVVIEDDDDIILDHCGKSPLSKM